MIQPAEGLKLVVGRALVGRCIYLEKSQPFPASIEIIDECIGLGSDFEKLVECYAEHVHDDLEEIEATGMHSLVSDFFVGIATPEGEFQRFHAWTLKEIRTKRRAFISEFNNSTVNRRTNKVDILFRVKMRAVPGAQSQESEESGGGWGFVTCRKTYAFSYQIQEGGLHKSYAEMPYMTLYRGLFFDKEFAQLYASKQVCDCS